MNALSSLAALLGVALASASGAAFVPGDVFVVPSQAGVSFRLLNITAGGAFNGSPGLATVEAPRNQMAWSADLTTLYVGRNFIGPSFISIWAITADGVVTSFATGAGAGGGIVSTSDGRLLTSTGNRIIDATAGGNLNSAPIFASGFSAAGNLVQLASGHILLVDAQRQKVYDITAGGNFTNDAGFAFGFSASSSFLTDIVQARDGRIFVADVSGGKVFDITSGGNFSSATPFAIGQNFDGLTVDGAGRLLASTQRTTGLVTADKGKVFDITAGGDFTFAAPFATGLTQGGSPVSITALDTVPTPEPTTALLACLGVGLLASRRNRKPL